MKVLRLVLLMALGALLYRGGVAVYESAPFELKEIEVDGNSGRRVSDDQIASAAGVAPGARLIGISTRRVGERIMEIPWIAKVRVERLLPSKLRISVVERRPDLLVVTAQGPYLVSLDGLVLSPGTESLIQVTDMPLGPLSAGDLITAREFVNAAMVYRSLPDAIRRSVSAISAPTIDQTTIRVVGGPSIFYGAAEQVEEKNFALQSLYGSSQPGTTIDVRVPSRPAVRNT